MIKQKHQIEADARYNALKLDRSCLKGFKFLEPENETIGEEFETPGISEQDQQTLSDFRAIFLKILGKVPLGLKALDQFLRVTAHKLLKCDFLPIAATELDEQLEGSSMILSGVCFDSFALLFSIKGVGIYVVGTEQSILNTPLCKQKIQLFCSDPVPPKFIEIDPTKTASLPQLATLFLGFRIGDFILEGHDFNEMQQEYSPNDIEAHVDLLMELLEVDTIRALSTITPTVATACEEISDERFFFGVKQYLVKRDRVTSEWESLSKISSPSILHWKFKRPKIVLVKDYMKDFVFPKPQPQPPEYFRISKLKLYTLGVAVKTNTSSSFECLIWSQYEAHKKSQDTCSALWNLYQTLKNPQGSLIAWSDNCVSQNTSWMLLFFHAFLVKEEIFQKVTLKQLKKGHTFNVVDARSGTIENASFKKNMFIPNDFKKVMEKCGCNVREMKQELFYKWDWLTKVFAKNKTSICGTLIEDIRGFYKYQFVKASDTTVVMRVKMTHLSSWLTINIMKQKGNVLKAVPPQSSWDKTYNCRIPPPTHLIAKLQVLVPYTRSTLTSEQIEFYFNPSNTTEDEIDPEVEDDIEESELPKGDALFILDLLKKNVPSGHL